MYWTERTTERLNGCYDFGILPVSASFKVTKRDNLNQIEQGYGFVAAKFTQVSIKVPPNGHELFAQSFLLIVTSAVEVDAMARARHAYDAMFAAAGTADQSTESRAWALAFVLLAIDTRIHFFGAPSCAGLGGGGMNP